jgi:5-(carboxyamino)imidazole ribonucleotide synthase
VDFSRELSAMVARTPDGETRAWPVVHTVQVDGVCDEVIAPALDIPVEVAAAAEDAAIRIANELGVTNSPCGRTTPATGPRTGRSPASSNSTCAPS